MFYKDGRAFEEAVFGTQDGKRKRYGSPDFSIELLRLLEQRKKKRNLPFPNTPIGADLFSGGKEELRRLGINPESLVFMSTLYTKVDYEHYSDGFFYLGILQEYPVTIDLFNTNTKRLEMLRLQWDESFDGEYTTEHFQNDLFLFKNGMRQYQRLHPGDDLDEVGKHTDFRTLAVKKRNENHLVLTPTDTENYESRLVFSRQVAECFYKALLQKKQQIEAHTEP